MILLTTEANVNELFISIASMYHTIIYSEFLIIL